MHFGEALKELYFALLEMSAIALAKHLGVPRTRIEHLMKCGIRMRSDTAFRLSNVLLVRSEGNGRCVRK